MQKLRLNLEQLTVDSFDTVAAPVRRGTVVGEEQCTCPTACSCPGCPTCDQTQCGQESCGSCVPCDTRDYYTCGPTPGYRTCDASATGGGPGMCECCYV